MTEFDLSDFHVSLITDLIQGEKKKIMKGKYYVAYEILRAKLEGRDQDKARYKAMMEMGATREDILETYGEDALD